MNRSNWFSGAVCVVIPVYGRENVFSTLAFLRAQAYAAQMKFAVIDNGNAPALAARLAELEDGRVHVVRLDENRGGSAAYIAGMDYAMQACREAEYVWLLDDDAVPNEGTLPGLMRTMTAALAENPRVACVGSAVLSATRPGVIAECGCDFPVWLGHARGHFAGRLISDVGEVTVSADYAAACSQLVNKAAVRACGFWEDVFIHFDDIEWGLRMKRAGWTNLATTASTVAHPEFIGYDDGRVWMTYYDARNKYWLASKYNSLYVFLARVKNLLLDVRTRLRGRQLVSVAYRRLAWADYRSGVRRLRSELVSRPVVLVAAHKPYRMPTDKTYRPVQTGAFGKERINDWQRDDEGENISVKNARWCELTGLYWGWKNVSADMLGLVHYRRHFKGKHGIATGDELWQALEGVDAVLPVKRNYFIETNYSQYAHAHHAVDLDVTRQIIAERSPESLAAFDEVMRTRRGHRFNMFVMRRKCLDAYCTWLFGILFELERRLDVSGYSAYDARVFGFVAERLLDVWIRANAVRYRELPVLHLESQHWPAKIVRFLRRKFFHARSG